MEKVVLAGITVAVTLSSSTYGMADDYNKVGSEEAKHVLLLSIDGMHAADFYNCSHGIAGVKGGGSVLPKYDGFEPNSNQLRGHHLLGLRTPFRAGGASHWRHASVDRTLLRCRL